MFDGIGEFEESRKVSSDSFGCIYLRKWIRKTSTASHMTLNCQGLKTALQHCLKILDR